MVKIKVIQGLLLLSVVGMISSLTHFPLTRILGNTVQYDIGLNQSNTLEEADFTPDRNISSWYHFLFVITKIKTNIMTYADAYLDFHWGSGATQRLQNLVDSLYRFKIADADSRSKGLS